MRGGTVLAPEQEAYLQRKVALRMHSRMLLRFHQHAAFMQQKFLSKQLNPLIKVLLGETCFSEAPSLASLPLLLPWVLSTLRCHTLIGFLRLAHEVLAYILFSKIKHFISVFSSFLSLSNRS